MINTTNLMALLSLCLIQISCTSALKKQCQETNWFEHGKSVALQGKRLNEDSFPDRCEKEGIHASAADLDLGFKSGMAKYCEPDIVYQTGKSGEFFNPDMCDPSLSRQLKSKHAEGVVAFCTPDSGALFGSSGKVYNKICPSDLENAFLREYKKGRRNYLTHAVDGKEAEIHQLDRSIQSDQYEKGRLQQELVNFNSNATITRQQVYDPFTRTYREETRTEQSSSDNFHQKNDLEWKISAVERRIEEARQRQQTLRNEIILMKSERDSL